VNHDRGRDGNNDREIERFWTTVDALVASSEVVIDRPKGSQHPRYPAIVYPLDYGYLADSRAMDGGGIDVWRGSLADLSVTAAIATIDSLKRDAEVKLLLGCTGEKVEIALATHRTVYQAAVLIRRDRASSSSG
jgi:inorganic pyrophosphatase